MKTVRCSLFTFGILLYLQPVFAKTIERCFWDDTFSDQVFKLGSSDRKLPSTDKIESELGCKLPGRDWYACFDSTRGLSILHCLNCCRTQAEPQNVRHCQDACAFEHCDSDEEHEVAKSCLKASREDQERVERVFFNLQADCWRRFPRDDQMRGLCLAPLYQQLNADIERIRQNLAGCLRDACPR